MILCTRLQVPVGSPWWLSTGADLILFLHIAGGAIALGSGAIALLAQKGGRTHVTAGLFLASIAHQAPVATVVIATISPSISIRPATTCFDRTDAQPLHTR